MSAYVCPTEVRMWRMLSLKPQRRSTRTFKTAAWTWTRPNQGSSISLPHPRVGGSAVMHSLRRRAAAVNDHGDFTLSLSLFPPPQISPLPPSVSKCLSPSSMIAHGDWGQMASAWWSCNIIHALFFPTSPSVFPHLFCLFLICTYPSAPIKHSWEDSSSAEH